MSYILYPITLPDGKVNYAYVSQDILDCRAKICELNTKNSFTQGDVIDCMGAADIFLGDSRICIDDIYDDDGTGCELLLDFHTKYSQDDEPDFVWEEGTGDDYYNGSYPVPLNTLKDDDTFLPTLMQIVVQAYSSYHLDLSIPAHRPDISA